MHRETAGERVANKKQSRKLTTPFVYLHCKCNELTNYESFFINDVSCLLYMFRAIFGVIEREPIF